MYPDQSAFADVFFMRNIAYAALQITLNFGEENSGIVTTNYFDVATKREAYMDQTALSLVTPSLKQWCRVLGAQASIG
jgi:hypothetical protein